MWSRGDLGVSVPAALTLGGMDLPLKVLFTGFDGPTLDEKVALAEAWADLLVSLAANGPSGAPQ